MRRHRPRVGVISEIPTPYRLPFYARLAERDEIELEVLFCTALQPDRPWHVERLLAAVPHRILPGRSVRLPGTGHVYEINPGIVDLLRRERFDVLVIGGYAVFTEQAAIAFAWSTRTPYLLHSESHLLNPRPTWVRAVKHALVGPIVGGSAAGLAVGTAAARYLAAYGLDPARIRIVPNTIDVAGYAAASTAARADADRVRAALGVPDRYLLLPARLVESKGIRILLEALDRLGVDAPHVVAAGDGPLRPLLERPGVTLAGFQPTERLIELYALADGVVLPSLLEPWGVVVNEALACGAPVIVSDVVGAAPDLVREGVDGRVVPAGDAAALAAALRQPLPRLEPAAGPVARWTYDLAVEQFLEGVALAVPR